MLVDDRFTQNALSTFVGTFLFSIVGIIALTTGLYGAEGRVVLFFATIVIVVVIVITLLRWIQHLSSFGRVRDTVERVEKVAREAMEAWAQAPHLGAQPPVTIPNTATAGFTTKSGYIVHIDASALAQLAERHNLTIHIAPLPGAFVFPERALVHIVGEVGDDCRKEIVDAFTIQSDRDFEQDPRFGLIVLSEIASRALSPAVNDPGTAIRVLGAGQRVLFALADNERGSDAGVHERVHAPGLRIEELFDDFFRPIARDGAGNIEVQLRLRATLAALATHAPGLFESSARHHAAAALTRAEAAMTFDDDLAILRTAAAGTL